ncbi:hypothetical protein BT63DRAFT_414619 [Microthyrium microscopicum]|uniref:Myb-like DNA-binding domain-containing protein n=1 Tax=Microthyrium microscopicum TaxID=703497 RepID=A0A6A6UAL8_9PEZI|nr:hypothetical protein BT63DRAFT_414619 [Microthyrium microscopicum]
MPTDKENVSFLYAIVRQLETKHVNWRLVAAQCNINNDHAARMRFHRLRQKADNLTPGKRGPRKDGPAAGKGGKKMAQFEDEEDDVFYPSLKRKKQCKKVEDESEDELDAHRKAKRLAAMGNAVVKNDPVVKSDLIIKCDPVVKAEASAEVAGEADVKMESLTEFGGPGVGVKMEIDAPVEEVPLTDAEPAASNEGLGELVDADASSNLLIKEEDNADTKMGAQFAEVEEVTESIMTDAPTALESSPQSILQSESEPPVVELAQNEPIIIL